MDDRKKEIQVAKRIVLAIYVLALITVVMGLFILVDVDKTLGSTHDLERMGVKTSDLTFTIPILIIGGIIFIVGGVAGAIWSVRYYHWLSAELARLK